MQGCSALPLEVWEMIAKIIFHSKKRSEPFLHFNKPGRLLSLLQCNRMLCRVAIRYFYRSVFLTRREHAKAFFANLRSSVTPWTPKLPRVCLSIVSISFAQGDEMAITAFPQDTFTSQYGDHQPHPASYTPALSNLGSLILLTSLTSLDLSNCVIPEQPFATLFAPNSHFRRNLRRLSLRGSAIRSLAIDWFLGRSSAFADHYLPMHTVDKRTLADYSDSDAEAGTDWDLPTVLAEYSSVEELEDRLVNDYPTFASYSQSQAPDFYDHYEDFPKLLFLDLATIYCNMDHIMYGVLASSQFRVLQELVVLDSSLALKETDTSEMKSSDNPLLPSPISVDRLALSIFAHKTLPFIASIWSHWNGMRMTFAVDMITPPTTDRF